MRTLNHDNTTERSAHIPPEGEENIMGERSQLLVISQENPHAPYLAHAVHFQWLEGATLIGQVAKTVSLMRAWDTSTREHILLRSKTAWHNITRSDLIESLVHNYKTHAQYGYPIACYAEEPNPENFDTNHGVFVIYLAPETWHFGFIPLGCSNWAGDPHQPMQSLTIDEWVGTMIEHYSQEILEMCPVELDYIRTTEKLGHHLDTAILEDYISKTNTNTTA
jgi:hypothetical protein